MNFLKTLKRWLDDNYGIQLVLMPGLECAGYYIHEEKIIFVNSNLSEEKMLAVVFHELGHYLRDDDVIGNYKDYVARSKMEYSANSYMIANLLDKWCNYNNVELQDVNCVTFLEVNSLPLNNLPIVEKIIQDKLNGKNW